MDNQARQQLIDILSREGRALARDAQRCESLLQQNCSQCRREINLIIGAIREQIPAELEAARDTVPPTLLYDQLASRLETNLGVTPDAARWSVETWAIALEVSASPPTVINTSEQNSPPTAIDPQPSAPTTLDPNSIPPPATQPSYPQTPRPTQHNTPSYPASAAPPHSPPQPGVSQPIQNLNEPPYYSPPVPESYRQENIYPGSDRNLQKPSAPGGLEYANFGLRFVAFLIDNVILFVGNLFLLGILGASSFTSLVQLAASWVYFAYFESSQYQGTPGKIIFGLTVTDLDGQPLDFSKASLRFLAKGLGWITLTVGFWMASFTEKRQALHDQVIGTLVLEKAKTDR